MNKANECTCPSGDGSLVHPCPAHPAVEQAGGDERAAFEAYRDRRNALIESEGHNPGSKWHVTNAHYPTWEASREAMAQPSPAQAEAERPEVVARVVHSNPVVLGQCGPLNANDELMTVAQHAASVARWAEMFNRVEQERDAALARVAELELKLDKSDYAYDNDRIHMRGLAARAIARAKVFDDGSDGADAESARSVVAILRELLAVGPAQAQHSVPDVCDGKEQNAFEDWASKEGMNMERHPLHWLFLDAKTYSARQGWKAALKYARNMLAAAPVCRLSRSALTEAQMRRLYENSTETENERLGFEAFARLIRRAEAVHQITAAPGKEGV
ncbi:TPA: hypothetical protein L4R67_001813 [Pseudomonas aeruginosa]|uniref:hypothetical protein n=1 Tax=Pseudomonas aeruginosa TaxID=287 RepID=UPI000F53599B|nr:hypothetical protein [Pseudomonas aeruginosa]HBO2930522.1 hypothetical protein [Pseudomonas aeruginosa]HEK2163424.1 hypothetical protein [Pseudomonas aeruginosa]